MYNFNKKLFSTTPIIMGILNVTEDSFYDGGRYMTEKNILRRAEQILTEGGNIIDIGAMSTRPNALEIPEEEEISRIVSAVNIIRDRFPDSTLSIDTYRASVAVAAVESGADMINDISGGTFDPDMISTIGQLQVPYCLMHTSAKPSEMQQHTGYNDIVDDLTKYFSQRLDNLYRLGVKDVWLDPGFGFAKTVEENHELLHRLDELTSLFREPMLAALSRKSMIYKPLGITPDEALPGTIALDTIALLKGVRLLRVHDPRPALQTIQLLNI